MRRLPVISCFFLGMIFAQAGEVYSESAFLGRFGQPTSERNFGFGKELCFEKDGFEILVDFLNGQACSVIFARDQRQEISEEKQLSILQKNFPQLAWKEEPPAVGSRHPVIGWTSPSPWKGTYADGILGLQNSESFAEYDHKLREYYAQHDVGTDKLIRNWLNQKPIP